MKTILVITESLRINETSSGIVSSTLIKLLHQSGYELTVITENSFDYPITWLPKEVLIKKFEIPKIKKNFIDYIPKIKAIPVYLSGFSKSFKNKKECYKIEIEKELSRHQYDSIYALSTGNSFVPHFALAEMNLSIPFYVNIHDPFPMHLYPVPYQKRKDWLNSILEKKFSKVLKKAKAISFPSKQLMDDMAKAFPIITQKGFVLPHIGTSLENLPTENTDDIVLDKSKINLLHAGTLLGPRNPKYLLQAISELNQENEDFAQKVAFTFIGKVNKALTDVISREDLKNVTFLTTRMSYKKSLQLIEQADASFVIEAIADFSPFLPGKVADIAFAEKPIIGLSPKKSEVRRLLGDNYPYQTELNNVVQIKNILLKFYYDCINSEIDKTIILNLKNYVSIKHNSEIIKKQLN
jgi:hypothetical protein